MFIKSVDFPSNYLDRGLKDIKMGRLGEIVAITGKNGSGKTRLLDAVREAFTLHLTPEQIIHLKHEIQSYITSIDHYKKLPESEMTVVTIKERQQSLSSAELKLESLNRID